MEFETVFKSVLDDFRKNVPTVHIFSYFPPDNLLMTEKDSETPHLISTLKFRALYNNIFQPELLSRGLQPMLMDTFRSSLYYLLLDYDKMDISNASSILPEIQIQKPFIMCVKEVTCTD